MIESKVEESLLIATTPVSRVDGRTGAHQPPQETALRSAGAGILRRQPDFEDAQHHLPAPRLDDRDRAGAGGDLRHAAIAPALAGAAAERTHDRGLEGERTDRGARLQAARARRCYSEQAIIPFWSGLPRWWWRRDGWRSRWPSWRRRRRLSADGELALARWRRRGRRRTRSGSGPGSARRIVSHPGIGPGRFAQPGKGLVRAPGIAQSLYRHPRSRRRFRQPRIRGRDVRGSRGRQVRWPYLLCRHAGPVCRAAGSLIGCARAFRQERPPRSQQVAAAEPGRDLDSARWPRI